MGVMGSSHTEKGNVGGVDRGASTEGPLRVLV